jgi:hypothetical protein
MAQTLRMAMVSREGEHETAFQIGRGLRAWAVERTTFHDRRLTLLVFGTCRSDAVRRAASPARLGEECHGDVMRAEPVASGWDEPIVWPLVGEAVA